MFIHHRTQHQIAYDRKLRSIAQELRHHPTSAESVVWQQLRARKLGYKFRRQHPLQGFIVDFYCYELMLVIEIDGSVHDVTQKRDKQKDILLIQNGYRVLRFSNGLVNGHLSEVIKAIKQCFPKEPLP
jgi:very-short-patch-repair endonuclease